VSLTWDFSDLTTLETRCFVAVVLNGYSCREVSRELGKPKGFVEQSAHRAAQKLGVDPR
jgi:DNA-directed RNA polymerase specialized sigma24 family protein